LCASVRVEVDWFSVMLKFRTIFETIRPLLEHAHMVYIVRSVALQQWYTNITITILDFINFFYLKHDVSSKCLKQRNVNKIYRFVRTSQETHYISATSPTG
jgi:hypothetical protein